MATAAGSLVLSIYFDHTHVTKWSAKISVTIYWNSVLPIIYMGPSGTETQRKADSVDQMFERLEIWE